MFLEINNIWIWKRETLNWCVMKLQIPVANFICWSTADYLYSIPTMYMFYQGLATIAGCSERNISRNVTAAEQFHATVNRSSRHSSCLVWQGRGPVLIKSFPGLVLHSLSRSQLVRYNCSWFFCQRVDVEECCCRTRYSASPVCHGRLAMRSAPLHNHCFIQRVCWPVNSALIESSSFRDDHSSRSR